MKCSYCNSEWKTLPGASGLTHDDNDCALSGVYTYPPVIQAINRAIHHAIIDQQAAFVNSLGKNLAEDCQHFGNCDQTISLMDGKSACCCPCSQWGREKNP